MDEINELLESLFVDVAEEGIGATAGIGLLCSAGAEICRDFGEGSLASKIEFAGKCTLLAYCLPLIKTVFEYASSFVN